MRQEAAEGLTIPTAITLCRLLMTLAIVAVFQVVDRPLADWIAVGLFAMAAVSDFLDGFLARRFKMESQLGRVLDPIADKVLISISQFVVVAYSGPVLFAFVPFSNNQIPACESVFFCAPREVPIGYVAIPATIILFREFLVSGLREHLANGAANLRVTWLAKWKSAVQMIALLVLLASGGLSTTVALHIDSAPRFMAGSPYAVSAGFGTAGIAMIWIACLLTIVTGTDYMVKAIRILNRG